MAARLEDRKAIIIGAGQTPGETIGNGRAMAMLFAREGAEVLCVDQSIGRADETAALIRAEGGRAHVLAADVAEASACSAIVAEGLRLWERIDILVNNVGIAAGDAPPHAIEEAAWDRILDVNLKSAAMTTRHVLPGMRARRAGAILNISSLAALGGHNMLAYEVSKMGMVRLTTATASANARYNVRCNVILPGLIDTPMAVEGIAARTGRSREDVRAERVARVPLGRMGTGWDIANAALFLCSDEAAFVTGAILPVDGGSSVQIG
jgi:NAD(P)-dependent dehydrogenase (short-subunit alcohol dehydrogenase family)